ncbi:MAG: hypothetical protein HQK60_05890 [Deltaproteobacteria bacterium]|nr:hypothetical protein [Deltaproteobacteria bacterium]
MSKDEPIDIKRELVDLFDHEEMMAFFEFSLLRQGNEPITGLCKISRPKKGHSKLKYLSLTFMTDTPDDESRRSIDRALNTMDGPGLPSYLEEVTEVVGNPALRASRENYIRQIDVLLEASDTGQNFITKRLLPAIRNLTHLRTGEVTWWETVAPAVAAASRPSSPAEAPGHSLLERLIGFFKG